jgi:5-methylcytosine-specific restriction endonuclease McrA
MKGQVLLLNKSYEALKVVSMERAMRLMLRFDNPARVELKEDKPIVTAGGEEFPRPSVIVLSEYRDVRGNIRKANVTRQRVFVRDKFRCQYCGTKYSPNKLTLDHVMPKSRGGEDVPENLVAACKPCNNKKADRTPDEAGMKLIKPVKPINVGLDKIMAHVYAEKRPEWSPYLFLGDTGDHRFQHVGE